MKRLLKIMFLLVMWSPLHVCPLFAAPLNTSPPQKTVRLVFIHHSVGENWLSDDQGRLGMALGKNNYFVSDTNYGWGPGNIGDRTDILNWPEWFTGKKSARYLKALYGLNNRNSSYTRKIRNPGGENTIIMFKSCYPNSQLSGRPGDGPRKGRGLTVANAKAIYNRLLTYFIKRPDKLFVAITAPPVLDSSRARNARAFNNWLVHQWLKNYKGRNVAVFDLYNVLTGPGHHHRVRKGKMEHVYVTGQNILHYPSGGSDEHPSIRGSRKATAEFIPVLNAFYHNWKKNRKYHRPVARRTKGQPVRQKKIRAEKTVTKPGARKAFTPKGKILDDFETGRCEWVVFSDSANAETLLKYKIKKAKFFKGKKGLEIDYQVARDSWATCSMVLAKPQDWKKKKGLSFLFRAGRIGQKVTFVVYQGGSPDDLHHFEFYLKGRRANVGKWQRVVIPWNRFVQPAWEGDGKSSFNPGRAMGVAFAFNESKGKIWVDDICFIK